MLIISRYEGEEIVIGDNIVVSVQSIRGEKIRLGIDAPKDVIVHRSEIADRRLKAAKEEIGE